MEFASTKQVWIVGVMTKANIAQKSFSFEIHGRILSTVVQHINKILSSNPDSLCLTVASLPVAQVLVN